ncbi:RHS repeat-associated core domain-containing protein [Flavobacterium silvaticum]|nr:RHS repeat-associated core domain-containing protein [Flavobacterium silvaticum]
MNYAYDFVDGETKILNEDHYYPFGLKHSNYSSGKKDFAREEEQLMIKPTPFGEENPYLYKYNGKELQDELGLNWYDFGARNYDPAIGRWMNIDPRAEKYQSVSTYNYALNNPMYYVDPNGEDIYLHYYLRNNNKDGKKDAESDKMFWQAALTRGLDFLNSGEGNSDDILIMRGIDSMDDLESTIESDIADNKDTYGKTAEFGLWSHSGLDGPFRENTNGTYDQLSVANWGKIDFNWGDNANARFYGCRSGKDPDLNADRASNGTNEFSFAQSLSSMANMRNVTVWGQTERSWPSSYTNVRSQENTGSTYMVGSKKASSGIQNFITAFNTTVLGQPTYAYPMATYQNGRFTGLAQQPGAVKK